MPEDPDAKKRIVVQRTWSAMGKLHADFVAMYLKMLFEADQCIALRFEGTSGA